VQAPDSKVIVVAGGFSSEEMVESSCSDIDTEPLEVRHEEADTRIVLHCVENHADTIVVQCRDTDAIALLLGHYHRMTDLYTALVQNRHSQEEAVYSHS